MPPVLVFPRARTGGIIAARDWRRVALLRASPPFAFQPAIKRVRAGSVAVMGVEPLSAGVVTDVGFDPLGGAGIPDHMLIIVPHPEPLVAA